MQNPAMLKGAIYILVLIFGCIAVHFSQQVIADCKPNRGWCPGEYRGLIVANSNYDDMVRTLGKPVSSVPAADQDEPIRFIWHDYGNIKGNLAGRLAVIIDKRTSKIVGISIAPDEMTKQEAIKYFGPGYTTMGYEFCDGFEGDVAPVYENPKATELVNIEYRKRGISISIGFRDQVNEISFVSEPTGLASKKECSKAANIRKRN